MKAAQLVCVLLDCGHECWILPPYAYIGQEVRCPMTHRGCGKESWIVEVRDTVDEEGE